MAKMKIVSCNKHDFDFGTRFQTKMVKEIEDALLGKTRQTYYFWGTKEFAADEEIEVDLDSYIIDVRDVEIDGKMMKLRNIVGPK